MAHPSRDEGRQKLTPTCTAASNDMGMIMANQMTVTKVTLMNKNISSLLSTGQQRQCHCRCTAHSPLSLQFFALTMKRRRGEMHGPEDGAVSVITSHPFIDRRLVFNWRKQEEPW